MDPAVIRMGEPLGPHRLVKTDVGGALFRAVLGSDLSGGPGDRPTLVPEPGCLRCFDPATDRALR